MNLKSGTTVILVFDTDAGNLSTLLYNIELLKKESSITEVLCITQVDNLEDEFRRSCGIKEIKELIRSRSNKDFKRDMMRDSNFGQNLLKFNY